MYFFLSPPKKEKTHLLQHLQEMKMIPDFSGGSQDDPEIFQAFDKSCSHSELLAVHTARCAVSFVQSVAVRFDGQEPWIFLGFDEHHTFGGIKWMLKKDVLLNVDLGPASNQGLRP